MRNMVEDGERGVSEEIKKLRNSTAESLKEGRNPNYAIAQFQRTYGYIVTDIELSGTITDPKVSILFWVPTKEYLAVLEEMNSELIDLKILMSLLATAKASCPDAPEIYFLHECVEDGRDEFIMVGKFR